MHNNQTLRPRHEVRCYGVMEHCSINQYFSYIRSIGGMKIKLEYNILILQDLLTDHVNIRRVQRQG
jgi:hypothetical protein